jgi:hypothetical protein
VVAWVVDDTGVVKDGKHSPGEVDPFAVELGGGLLIDHTVKR